MTSDADARLYNWENGTTDPSVDSVITSFGPQYCYDFDNDYWQLVTPNGYSVAYNWYYDGDGQEDGDGYLNSMEEMANLIDGVLDASGGESFTADAVFVTSISYFGNPYWDYLPISIPTAFAFGLFSDATSDGGSLACFVGAEWGGQEYVDNPYRIMADPSAIFFDENSEWLFPPREESGGSAEKSAWESHSHNVY